MSCDDAVNVDPCLHAKIRDNEGLHNLSSKHANMFAKSDTDLGQTSLGLQQYSSIWYVAAY